MTQSKTMFGGLFKRKQKKEDTPTDSVEKGLDKTSSHLLSKIGQVFRSAIDLDDEVFEQLEEVLMSSDIGIQASLDLVDQLRERVTKEKISSAEGVIQGLRYEIASMLQKAEQPWQQQQTPYVILMVGVNGVGKTTSTAKIAHHFQQQGHSVMLAAADTFRAAAIEQLANWGERLNIPVIAQQHGGDAAAVAHDALTSAKAKNVDILIIDTAGRLHTQTELMQQLEKVIRVIKKVDPEAPHDIMQVLDAGTGQNALNQLDHFKSSVNVSSLCLTKLDGSAKGGVALALTQKHRLPIRFIGVGEKFSDLVQFDAMQFANALIPDKEQWDKSIFTEQDNHFQ